MQPDAVVPAFFGKRYVLAYTTSAPFLYGIWDIDKLADGPVETWAKDDSYWRLAFASFVQKEPQYQEAVAVCPTCGSKWVYRIREDEKQEALFFPRLSDKSKIIRTFRCGRCQYVW